jgi:hypothetical protein
MRIAAVAVAVILAVPALAIPARADDAVLAGYRRYYAGDKEGAQHDFERLLSARPADLPARFGLLEILEDLSRETRALEPEFERQIDALLTDADARHARSETDDEALFYLANGYLLRARYRVSHNKGLWGAARDGVRSKRLSETYLKRHPNMATRISRSACTTTTSRSLLRSCGRSACFCSCRQATGRKG